MKFVIIVVMIIINGECQTKAATECRHVAWAVELGDGQRVQVLMDQAEFVLSSHIQVSATESEDVLAVGDHVTVLGLLVGDEHSLLIRRPFVCLPYMLITNMNATELQQYYWRMARWLTLSGLVCQGIALGSLIGGK